MATPIALQNFLTQSSPQFSSRMTPYDFATTAGSTALGIGNNARAMRQLEEQLALAEKEYENMISEQKSAKQLALFQLGAGTPAERKNFINEYSGGTFGSSGLSFTKKGEAPLIDLVTGGASSGGGTGSAVSTPASVSKKLSLGTGYGYLTDTRDTRDTGRPYYTARPYEFSTSESQMTPYQRMALQRKKLQSEGLL